MIEITYYVHGATLDNENKIATGWDQVSLSLKGIEQTREAALQVDSNIFDAIFTSDLVRAIESAQLLFMERKNEIKVDYRLRECNYGALTKTKNKDLIYNKHIEVPFHSGESLRDVEIRIRSFLKELKFDKYKKIAIVSHRAPQLALDVITTGISWEEAIKNDWRVCGCWKPGWHYIYDI